MEYITIPVITVDEKKDREIEDYFDTKKVKTREAQKIVNKWKTENEEVEMLQGIIKRVSKIHPPKFNHFCHEWDGLEINEYDPEFGACTCFK
jgi:hypothetical protein